MKRALLLAGLLSLCGTANAVPLPHGETLAIKTAVEERERLLADVSKAIWGFAELGFQETRSAALLQAELKKARFDVKAGVADMPTAFVASFKTGDGPVIALLAEYDALPDLSQSTSPFKEQLAGHVHGHACGHNLFGAAAMISAMAVKDWMIASGINGEIRVYGTPAEESGAGKVYMVRAGLFDDVDAVVVWHPWDRNEITISRNHAVVNGSFRFYGAKSPSATMPERGTSALDGLELANIAANYLRGRIPLGTSLYYTIRNGGEVPNIVPDFAEGDYAVRHHDPEIVRSVWNRLIKAGEGAAVATGTRFEAEITGAYYPVLPSETLAQVADRIFRDVGGVQWTAEETRWAETIQKTLPEQVPLSTIAEIRPIDRPDRRGASDVGDVSWITPTITVITATWVPGTPAHDWQAVAASGHSIGVKGSVVAAKVMALTMGELYRSPETLDDAKAELLRRRGPEFKYQTLLGNRPPSLEYRE